jgi:hypothetical protein
MILLFFIKNTTGIAEKSEKNFHNLFPTKLLAPLEREGKREKFVCRYRLFLFFLSLIAASSMFSKEKRRKLGEDVN